MIDRAPRSTSRGSEPPERGQADLPAGQALEQQTGGKPDRPPAGTGMPVPGGGKPFDPPVGGKADRPPPATGMPDQDR